MIGRGAAALDSDSVDCWHGLRIAAIGLAILFVIIVGASCWIVFTQSHQTDFLSYWAAGKLVIQKQAAAAYDIAVHGRVERSAAALDGLLPFPYPPPFLMVVAPFGLLPFHIASPVWVLATALIYYAAARRLAPAPYLFAQPAVVPNGMIGQNGFLFAAIFIAGTRVLATRPFLGGAILGLFLMKPQLGLLLPVAVIAARLWRAVAGAAATAAILLLAAMLLFGVESYRGFLAIAPHYTQFMREGSWPWVELASPFAFARWFGVPATAALIFHGIVALGGAGLVWRAWRNAWPRRIEVLAAATMLIPPYIFTYDSLLMVVPIAWLVRQQRHPFATAVVWLCCFLPVASYFGYYSGPNTIPIAAILSLALLWMDRRRTVQSDPSEPD